MGGAGVVLENVIRCHLNGDLKSDQKTSQPRNLKSSDCFWVQRTKVLRWDSDILEG